MANEVQIVPERYQAVEAGQSNVSLEVVGGQVGDVLEYVEIVPETTSPGAVTIKDGGGSAITLFPGGASSVLDLKPFLAIWGARSRAGKWTITTGANVSVIAFGRFS